jgi:hypothetical protein
VALIGRAVPRGLYAAGNIVPKARTWGRRGHTPAVTVSGKGSGRVSVTGVVCLKPDAPGRFFYRMRVHRRRKGERRSLSEADYADLIAAAHRTLAATVIVIWDNLNTHTSTAAGRGPAIYPVKELTIRLRRGRSELCEEPAKVPCRETGPRGSEGSHAAKDLPSRHLAAWLTRLRGRRSADPHAY